MSLAERTQADRKAGTVGVEFRCHGGALVRVKVERRVGLMEKDAAVCEKYI